MARAVILLHHERRKEHRTMTEDRGQVREIPIRDADDEVSKPLVTTTAKVIAWLGTLLTLVVVVVVWLASNRFESIVDSRFDKFELRLTREYALKADTLPRPEYELRHAELIQMDKQAAERQAATERRLDALSDRVGQLERRH